MIRVEREIDVARSAGEVFERLTRIEDLPRWQPAIVEATLTTPGPIDVGSSVRIVAVAGGKRTEAVGTVTEFERPRLLGLDAASGPANVTARVTVTPLGEAACRVGLETAITLGGMLRFVEGMARSRIEKEAPTAAAAVKEWLESDG